MMLASVTMRPPGLETTEISMTSVTVLPSSTIYTPPAQLLSKRPKLTLNTGHQRIYGKGPTSLRLETLSAISPTLRNTFSNTFASPDSPHLCGEPEPFARPGTPLRTEHTASDAPNYSATPTSGSTSSSADSMSLSIPYQPSHCLISILLNSPIPRIDSHKMSFATSRPMFPCPKRVSFRNPLSEEIKTQKYTLAHSDMSSASSSTISSLSLSIDVLPGGQTPGPIIQSPSAINFLLEGSDDSKHLGSSPTSNAWSLSLQSQNMKSNSPRIEQPYYANSCPSSEFTFSLPSPREDNKHDSLEPLASSSSIVRLSPVVSSFTAKSHSPSPITLSPKSSPALSGLSSSPRVGEKRDSSSSEEEEEEEEEEAKRDTRAMYPCTPVAGRRKRRREWVWTLDPLPGMGPTPYGGQNLPADSLHVHETR